MKFALASPVIVSAAWPPDTLSILFITLLPISTPVAVPEDKSTTVELVMLDRFSVSTPVPPS